MIMTTKEIGDYGEKLAVKLLKKKHYRIINRNLHFSKNELPREIPNFPITSRNWDYKDHILHKSGGFHPKMPD